MNKTSRQVIFIAGYGRSGSTLLCAVLGGVDNAVALGELNRIFLHYKDDKKCACFKVLDSCDFWRPIVEEFERRVPEISLDKAAEVTMQIESYKNWFLRKHKNSELEKLYQKIWMNMFEIIFETSGKSLIIDASKSSSIACNRAAAISRFMDLKQIHLVRDPRAVTSSTLEAQTRRLVKHGIRPTRARGLRTVLSWLATNSYIHFCSVLRLKKIDLRVSYEAITEEPLSTLTELSGSLDLRAQSIIETIQSGGTFAAGHIFSGDLQRMKGDYIIQQNPAKWPNVLSKKQVVMCWFVYPLARYYGYFRNISFRS